MSGSGTPRQCVSKDSTAGGPSPTEASLPPLDDPLPLPLPLDDPLDDPLPPPLDDPLDEPVPLEDALPLDDPLPPEDPPLEPLPPVPGSCVSPLEPQAHARSSKVTMEAERATFAAIISLSWFFVQPTKAGHSRTREKATGAHFGSRKPHER